MRRKHNLVKLYLNEKPIHYELDDSDMQDLAWCLFAHGRRTRLIRVRDNTLLGRLEFSTMQVHLFDRAKLGMELIELGLEEEVRMVIEE